MRQLAGLACWADAPSRTWRRRRSRGSLPGAAPHHTVLSTAVDTEQLVDFAKLLGVELLIIHGSTNRRDFADRICWNQAPYRLCPGVLRQAF